MRYLKPNQTIKIKEDVYPLIFSLDVIDNLQDKVQMPMNEIASKLGDEKTRKVTAQCLIKYLTGQVIDDNIEYYSYLLLNTYIEQLKYKNAPETKQVEGDVEFEYIDVEYWYYIGKVVLGLSEEETWGKTLGQLRTMREEHFKYMGWKKDDSVVNIDDVIPE